MRAIVATRSGPPSVLKLMNVDKPEPKINEMLVEVHASSVTAGDVVLRKMSRLISKPMGYLFGFKPQKITGTELSGKVVKIGSGIRNFKKGDLIFGTSTGLVFGGNAEYVCIPENWKMGMVAYKPKNTSFEQAAVIPVGAMTALQILKKGNIKNGQKVMINGASGSVGTYAVQIAKYFGAEVTGICSGKNTEMVLSIGADKVIDYTKEDLKAIKDRYDIVFDTVRKGNSSILKGLLRKGGVFLTTLTSTNERNEDLDLIRDLVEKGHIKPVIDMTYPLEKTAEAHEYVDKGHKRGNIAIKIR